jgi:predicted TPR repeat methyltransferase
MIDPQKAYNSWANIYDSVVNKTRDLEGQALQTTLSHLSFDSYLEIGCGTGKNTVWLLTKAKHITAVDLSEEMLAKAQQKITSASVEFIQADITKPWSFIKQAYHLIGFSLVLEHINDLDYVFAQAAQSLVAGGWVYIGELHPFKQYNGSKARFETAEGLQIVTCFNHHITDFIRAAQKNGLALVEINEYFDDDNRNEIPRILTLLLQKRHKI